MRQQYNLLQFVVVKPNAVAIRTEVDYHALVVAIEPASQTLSTTGAAGGQAVQFGPSIGQIRGCPRQGREFIGVAPYSGADLAAVNLRLTAFDALEGGLVSWAIHSRGVRRLRHFRLSVVLVRMFSQCPDEPYLRGELA